MLRFNADVRTVVYMIVTTGLFIAQWLLPTWQPLMWFPYLFLSVAVTVIAHNHNHLPIWRVPILNTLTDYWLTIFYGFPAFAWIPTHNLNHHVMNNREGDYTITYRVSEKNAWWTMLIYPSVSSWFQQKPIKDYLKKLQATDKRKFMLSIMQYAALAVWIATFLILDWQKAILYVIIPQQVGLFAVLVFNYVQHVHADEESKYNHSRNFTGFLNVLLFNNGYHTVHHERAGTHWSKTPEFHKQIESKIDPALLERSFWWYIIRVYLLGAFSKRFRTDSMRLKRMEHKLQA